MFVKRATLPIPPQGPSQKARPPFGAKRQSRRRKGWSTLEALAAIVALVAAQTFLLQLVSATSRKQRQQADRQQAVHEAANILERLSVRKWDEINERELNRLPLSDGLRQRLDGVKLKIDVAAVQRPVRSKRITVRIHWLEQGTSNQVMLVGWHFAEGDRS